LLCPANVTVFISTVHDQPIEFIPPLDDNRTLVVYIDEERPLRSIVFRPVVRDVDYPDAVFRYELNSTTDGGYLTIDPTTGNEEVVLQLIKSKCLPILLYGLEPFDLSDTDPRSLDFVINRFFMKLFKTTSMEIVQLCRTYFCFELPSGLLKKRTERFRNKYNEYHYSRCECDT